MPKKKLPETVDPAQRVIDAALALAARQRWSRIGLADIAAEAGLPIAQTYAQFRSKPAILDGLMRRVDMAVLGGAEAEVASAEDATAEGGSRDRLFDTLMRRFDALQPHKEGLKAIIRDSVGNPAVLLSGAGLLRSMAWMLEASGISAAGLRGRLRVPAVTALYLSVFRVFLEDDSPDLARTMATLDRQLRRGERLLGLGTPGAGSV